MGFNGDDERLRRAIRDDNFFLVRRILARIGDPRNPDPVLPKLSSMGLAAVCAHEDVFTYFLNDGHDDETLSRDAENNTILCLLAGVNATEPNLSASSATPKNETQTREALARMARAYLARYPFLVDWTNDRGKTPLHISSIIGNYGIANVLCDCGADLDLTDEDGNTPLHYASSWGHLLIVQTLIERGCKYNLKNNDGFTPSDLAYSLSVHSGSAIHLFLTTTQSHSTMQSLQEYAQIQFETNKKARRQIYKQAASRGNELRTQKDDANGVPDLASSSSNHSLRLRSTSGASASDSATDYDTSGASHSSGTRPASRPHQGSLSSSTSSQPSNSSHQRSHPRTPQFLANVHGFSTPKSKTQPAAVLPAPLPSPSKARTFARNIISPSRSMQQLSSFASGSATLLSTPVSPRRQQSIDLNSIAERMVKRDADAIAAFKSISVSINNPLASSISTPLTPTSESSDASTPSAPRPRSRLAPETNGASGTSTLQSRLVRSVLRPSASAVALRANTADLESLSRSQTPTTNSSRLRSTTLDYYPAGPSVGEDTIMVVTDQDSRTRSASGSAAIPSPIVPSSGRKVGGLASRERRTKPPEQTLPEDRLISSMPLGRI